MNQIVNLNTASTLTMSSREIAELVESNHADVRRSIGRLADRGVITLPPLAEVPNTGPGPKRVKAYLVGKRDSYVVVAQLSPEFTGRLVDRWMELEAQVASAPATDVSEIMAQHMADMQERIVAPLVQAVADLIRNQAPQSPTAQRSIPSAADLVPELTSKMVSKLDGVPANLTNQEIGFALSDYSRERGFKVGQQRTGSFKLNLYCRAAVRGCFGLI